ncbi:MAG: hypothetical protein WC381_08935 [Kiritimatiellia bacterium]|jgi:hypothetical protein
MKKLPRFAGPNLLTILAFTLLLPLPSLLALKYTDSHLYTKSDPAASGGIRATLAASANPVQHAFAIDNGNPKLVYKGSVSEDGKEIQFTGLPAASYDLVLVASDRFYEGCRLARDPDALTDRDRQFISDAIEKSVPFFNAKKIHRCEGTSGRDGKARAVLQEMRIIDPIAPGAASGGSNNITRGYYGPIDTSAGTPASDIQIRSLKLALTEDVGEIGWQLTMTREILRTIVGPKDKRGFLLHCYSPILGGIRVVDTEKDLGELNPANGISASKE